MSSALSRIVEQNKGKIRIEFRDQAEDKSSKKNISISISCEESKSPINIEINLDHLIEALDYSRIYVEAIHSQADRERLGICNNETWTLQYCLNLFDVFKTCALYQNIELSLKAWLYKIYDSCSYYRKFMDYPDEKWWRNAWWQVQNYVECKHKTKENLDFVLTNCCDYYKKPLIKDDPFSSLAGRLTLYVDRLVKPYSIDDASNLYKYDYEKKKHVLREFRFVEVNGVRWSICQINYGQIAIDLSASKEVEELKDGIVIIPHKIDNFVVTKIFTLAEGYTHNWRKVIFADSSEGKESLTLRIGNGAFSSWPMLEEIVCERCVCELGRYAFDNCLSLEKVDITKVEELREIGDRCFRSCSSLKDIGSIRSPWHLTIGMEAFSACTSLKSIVIGESVTMDELAFAGCSVLESVRIESKSNEKSFTPRTLPRRAFWGCVLLKEVFLPADVVVLNDECFVNCFKDCKVHFEGSNFWFIGINAIPRTMEIYYWGQKVWWNGNYMVLSDLLDRNGVREQYIEICSKHKGKKYDILRIIRELLEVERTHCDVYHDYHDYHDNHQDDYLPTTYEDAYEIYGSRLYDA